MQVDAVKFLIAAGATVGLGAADGVTGMDSFRQFLLVYSKFRNINLQSIRICNNYRNHHK